jgi:hypothetical protein
MVAFPKHILKDKEKSNDMDNFTPIALPVWMPTRLFCTADGSRIIGFYSQHFFFSLDFLGLTDHILKISWELQVIKIVCHAHEIILIGSIFTEGYYSSAFNLELKNIYWIYHYQ